MVMTVMHDHLALYALFNYFLIQEEEMIQNWKRKKLYSNTSLNSLGKQGLGLKKQTYREIQP